MIEESIRKALDNMIQLREKRGSYYDHWLSQYRKAMKAKGSLIANRYHQERWLSGIRGFLKQVNKKY